MYLSIECLAYLYRCKHDRFRLFHIQQDPIAAIALDDSRNVLYTLSHKSNIEVIYLGADCDQFIKVAKNAEIAKQAQLLCPTSPLLDSRNFQIVSIHPVLSTESRLIHLVAVTSSGM